MNKKILVTGAAGFIGFNLAKRLLNLGHQVIGIDNLNDYYDADLKVDRLKELGVEVNGVVSNSTTEKFQFHKIDLTDKNSMESIFKNNKIKYVCHLAAQAGVRYSIENPDTYINSNILGFHNIINLANSAKVERFVYASSSSIYGISDEFPFVETASTDNPISLYAATKKSNELIAHTYSHLFNLETIGLRFFTVYGPWGRPDMAMFLFMDAILKNQPIKIFNQGELYRDFTYVDDIVRGVEKTLFNTVKNAPKYRIYNIGNNKPVKLTSFVEAIEKFTGKEAIKEQHPMQPGDVYKTWANVEKLQNDYGYKSSTSVEEGVKNTIAWFQGYKKSKGN